MNDKFRLAGNVKEFFSDLKNLKNVEHDLMIWQNSGRGKKKITEGKFESYKSEKDNIIITIEMNKTISLDQENDVFIFAKDAGILFKGKYEYCVARKLKLIADEKFYLKEKRDLDRFFFNYTKIDISITKIFDDKPSKSKVLLNDISKNGMGFFVTSSKVNTYEIGQIISLNSIHGVELPRSISGVVKHITSRKKKLNTTDGKFSQVGVEFNESNRLIERVMLAMGAETLNSKEF